MLRTLMLTSLSLAAFSASASAAAAQQVHPHPGLYEQAIKALQEQYPGKALFLSMEIQCTANCAGPWDSVGRHSPALAATLRKQGVISDACVNRGEDAQRRCYKTEGDQPVSGSEVQLYFGPLEELENGNVVVEAAAWAVTKRGNPYGHGFVFELKPVSAAKQKWEIVRMETTWRT